ncbi:hypothetical protein CXF68_14875 [Tenacibaculum sp. Bg11-29]|uniref:hypothetical protein n=1 Tax=Tenacibaculum sp. Bg11-29 TaxID=2058306 RepID=UPI000C326538|nr:hypothetical protein [Tenacibaculum sp. Bg11-29]PKH51890.1 hypothetical protein CXF68_14875 [Tenacibaculum sp. Bg11-29]
MKIKLSIKINELISLHKITSKLYDLNFSLLEKEEKIAVSIGLILADKFDKKYKTIQKKLDLFEAKKPISFTLDFHEAWALKKLCFELYGIGENHFEKLGIQNVLNKLDRDGC